MVSKASIKNILYVFIASSALFFASDSRAYFMPVEQLVKMMVSNLSRFNSLVITQSVRQINQDNEEEAAPFKERVWLKAPNFFHAKILGNEESGSLSSHWMKPIPMTTDRVFRRLLMPQEPHTVMTLLSRTGVDLESVGFARVDDVIAYRIGDKSPESPKLLIAKKTFLPLLFKYWMATDQAKRLVTVRFHDYRKLTNGWYPFMISYVVDEDIPRHFSIVDLEVNVPIEYQLEEIPIETPVPSQAVEKGIEASEEERLRDIIQMLKEKYR